MIRNSPPWTNSFTLVAMRSFAHAQGKFAAKRVNPSVQFASVRKLEEALWHGGVWVGEPSSPGKLRCELTEWPTSTPVSPAETWTTAWPAPVLPPLASKLYIESNLREAPGRNA